MSTHSLPSIAINGSIQQRCSVIAEKTIDQERTSLTLYLPNLFWDWITFVPGSHCKKSGNLEWRDIEWCSLEKNQHHRFLLQAQKYTVEMGKICVIRHQSMRSCISQKTSYNLPYCIKPKSS